MITAKITNSITAVDLFCGAGGTSTGLINAATSLGKRVDLTAINHWDKAIETHSKNHPGARHLCESLDNVNPRKLFPQGRIQLLVASPECTHHSRARGGVPCSDQSRSTAWKIVEWASALYIDNILIENVPEFMSWGPLGADGTPMKSKRGETFQAFKAVLESLGYRVDHRILNAADYGDPTCRERFFLIARRGNRRIRWPEPTHAAMDNSGRDIFGKDFAPWVPARDIIDWQIPGQSIFERERPLAEKTMARIEHGLRKFGGKEFITIYKGKSKARAIGSPLPTLTTGQNLGVCEPFLLPQHQGRPGELRVRSLTKPLPTITATGSEMLIEPFLIKYFGTGKAQSVNIPLSTITTRDRFGLVETFRQTPGLDIRLRMLQPHELAAAQSFPKGYQFVGCKRDVVKQIGNAVPGRTAKALCGELIA